MKTIYGRKPVYEALKAGEAIQKIEIAHGTIGEIIFKIKALAKKNDIKISEISGVKFKKLSETKNTQGVIAYREEFKYSTFPEIMKGLEGKKNPLLLILDSIQDPHNLGAILRTAECAGVDGVILTLHNSADINDTVSKIAAGAVSHLKICQVKNLNNIMKDLKESGFWVAGAALQNSKEYTELDYKMPLALVMGNEGKGIRKLVLDNCDFVVRIPMQGKIDSLNVSVATGVFLFEILRQRNH